MQSARADILLFLLVQTALALRASHSSIGVSNPWTEYLRFLPENIPVPTLWNEDERLLLRGTSLETAVNAKMLALEAEFDAVQDASSNIPCWNDTLWESGAIGVRDWMRLDALYRSRCLELPKSGEAIVPCIDMINHSSNASTYYDEDLKDDVVLLPRPGLSISQGRELTISYGDTKSAAEMLFSYGFIDPESSTQSLVLPLEPFDDDPLAKAKLVGFGEAPKVRVVRDGDSVVWESPFVHLMCVNEEDGLEFRVLQDTEGDRQLRVFWRGDDVTNQTKKFESLIRSHPLSVVFRLRIVTVVQERLQTQLELAQMYGSETNPGNVREECLEAAQLLRRIETSILESAVDFLDKEVCSVEEKSANSISDAAACTAADQGLMQKNSLLTDKNVVAYLGSTETAESDLVDQEATNEVEEDFS